MYKQSRGGFGNVSTRAGMPFLPENYSGNAFRKEDAAKSEPEPYTDTQTINVSAPTALLPAPLKENDSSVSAPLSAIGNVLSGDAGLLLLVLLVLAAGGGKRDDGALLMILLLLCL